MRNIETYRDEGVAMHPASPARQSPLYESPWFWVYLFATAALAILLLANAKITGRQAQLERNMQARQRAAQVRAGETPTVPLSPPDKPQIGLAPLYALLTILLLVGWVGLWYTRLRHRTAHSVPRQTPPSPTLVPETNRPPDEPVDCISPNAQQRSQSAAEVAPQICDPPSMRSST